MEERLERQARNEALVREVNERINALDRDAAGSGAVEGVESFRFHCECGREGGCPEQIWMTLEEYEVVLLPDDLVLLERHPDLLRAAALAAALAVEAERLDALDGAATGRVAVERVDPLVHLADERFVPGLPLEALLHARILARVRGVGSPLTRKALFRPSWPSASTCPGTCRRTRSCR